MKTSLYVSFLFLLLLSCKKETTNEPPPNPGKYYVSKMFVEAENEVSSAVFEYNPEGGITKVTGDNYVMNIVYGDNKKVTHIDKVYQDNAYIISADYSYSQGRVSREERHESLPPDVAYRTSYNYDWADANSISKLTFINSNDVATYKANFEYGSNNNPSRIVSTAGQATEFTYSSRDFKLFPGNDFVYSWLDMFLTHEYHYYVPFTKEITRVRRNNPGGAGNWYIDLAYEYNNLGYVSKLTWTFNYPVIPAPTSIVYRFEYTRL